MPLTCLDISKDPHLNLKELKKEFLIWCLTDFANDFLRNQEKNFIIEMTGNIRDIRQAKILANNLYSQNEKLNKTDLAMLNILEDAKFLEGIIKKERDQATAIISSMGEGLIVIDTDYNIIIANNMAENILGVPLNELLGGNIKSLIGILKGEEIISEENRPVSKMFKTGNIIRIEMEDNFYYQVFQSGKKFPVSIAVTPLKKGDIIIGAVVVFQDISEEKAIDESKTNFISTASHQLRTPLTAIRWYAEMLNAGDAGPLTDEQKKFLNEIYGGVLRLSNTLNIFLILARIEGGQIKVKTEKINIINIFQFSDNIVKELDPMIKKKNLNVQIKPDCQQVSGINLDPTLLSQVITNLLSNAIRYTNNNGNIEIGIKCSEKEMTYYVKDDGIGIPENQKEKIFEKFFRAENAIIKVPDGNGLGLALVKSLVKLWGGKVWFDSEINSGTTFYFTIPV